MSIFKSNEIKNNISMMLDAFQDTETYNTSLYLHKSNIVRSKANNNIDTLEIDFKKDIKKDKLVRATLTRPYGTFLTTFLNADFSSAEKAYYTFFVYYGLECFDGINFANDFIAKECAKRYNSTEDFLIFYYSLFESFIAGYVKFQNDIRKTVDFVFNLHGSNSCMDLDKYSKFAAFSASINLIDKFDAHFHFSLFDDIEKKLPSKMSLKQIEQLAYDISDKKQDIGICRIYEIYSHLALVYLSLIDLIQNSKKNISICQNCGRYYVQNSGKEVYCDLFNLDGKPSCKTYASRKAYDIKVTEDEAELAYKRDYQRRITQVYRATGSSKQQLKNEYLLWKTVAREQLKLYRQGKITKDEFCKWIEENKELKGD